MDRVSTRGILLPVLTVSLTLSASAPVAAQARGRAVPRPAVSAPVHVRPPVYVHGPRYGYGYGYPYYRYGFSIGFGIGFAWYPGYYYPYYPYGWYPYYRPYYYPPYPVYPYYSYGPLIDELTASLRLEVKPRETEVYVDGYRAGTVDNFDGVFQRLRVRPGEHTIVLYLDGFRTVEQQMYLGHGSDQRVKLEMEKLAAGESSGPRPVPPPADEPAQRPAREPLPDDPRRGRGAAPPDIQVQQEPAPRSFGVVVLNVQPLDAEILIDGAPWAVPAGDKRLVVQLPEGRHRVEIRKAGFETYAEEVAIQRGRILTLNVSLIRNPGGGR